MTTISESKGMKVVMLKMLHERIFGEKSEIPPTEYPQMIMSIHKQLESQEPNSMQKIMVYFGMDGLHYTAHFDSLLFSTPEARLFIIMPTQEDIMRNLSAGTEEESTSREPPGPL